MVRNGYQLLPTRESAPIFRIPQDPQEFAPVRTRPQAPIRTFRGLMRIGANSCGMVRKGHQWLPIRGSAALRRIPHDSTESAPIRTNPQASIRTFRGLVRVGADSRGMVRNGAEWCGMAINRFRYEDPHQSAGSAGIRTNPQEIAPVRTKPQSSIRTFRGLMRIGADSCGMVRNGAEWPSMASDTRIRSTPQDSA